jgi:hypothetical protein
MMRVFSIPAAYRSPGSGGWKAGARPVQAAQPGRRRRPASGVPAVGPEAGQAPTGGRSPRRRARGRRWRRRSPPVSPSGPAGLPSELTPPLAITGMETARASASVAATFGPCHRAVAVDVGVDDRGDARILEAAGQIGGLDSVSSAQPRVATRPRARRCPTATWPGKARAASRTSSPGSSTATVPRITRATPLPSQVSIVAMSRMPPPSWQGISDAARIASTAAPLTGWPAKAPLRSTRCSHSHPALEGRGLGGGVVAEDGGASISPRSRRTHWPSLRSMAG